MIIIDAKNLILGRFASFAAKKAILGEQVRIINCEKAVISASRSFILSDTLRKRRMGVQSKGPFFYKNPDLFVRRVIRGMMPYKTFKGKNAYKRIYCYIGVPEQFKDKPFVTIDKANVVKMKTTHYSTIGEICKLIGGKIE